MSHVTIRTDSELEQFCQQLVKAEWIALDTEFVAERTYRPQLCLVQVATADEMAIIDPLAVTDMRPFWEALSQPGHETIVHAGRGEVEFCLRAVGRRPAGLFDVQIAAGLVGLEYPAAFNTLLSRLLGAALPKLETRTHWARRPLTRRQIQYALDDVRHLSALRHRLHQRLEALGRLAWMEEEMALWQEAIQAAVAEQRWRRISGISGLDPRGLAVARELWRWRDAVARRRDRPPRRVLRDDLIVELARCKTTDIQRIRALRGLERGDLARQLPAISQCIQRALALPESELPRTRPNQSVPQLPVLGQFLYAALTSICRQAQLAPGLVGTPSDVRELVAYRTGLQQASRPPRLATGWRAEVVGKTFDELLTGRLAIRIDDPLSEHPLVFDRNLDKRGSASER